MKVGEGRDPRVQGLVLAPSGEPGDGSEEPVILPLCPRSGLLAVGWPFIGRVRLPGGMAAGVVSI